MEPSGYQQYSSNQYSAHSACLDLLEDSMERLAKRMSFGDLYSLEEPRRYHFVDLGSADGSNSLLTLGKALQYLRGALPGSSLPPLHFTFEEHPASNRAALEQVLTSQNEWLDRNDITYSVLMKSFYEPLFAPNSVDFFMSFICLHWLDTDAALSQDETGSLAKWKRLASPSSSFAVGRLSEFTFLTEVSTPPSLREVFQREIASEQLAQFLCLRAAELRPGGEALLVMVGDGHNFVNPPDGGPSALTRAIQRCVERKELRPTVADNVLVPYYLRTAEEVQFAVKKAQEAGALIELAELRSFSTITGGNVETNDNVFKLFWSIHSGAVMKAGPTEKEINAIREATREFFDDLYDPFHGVESKFVVCVIRRRTRSAWSDKGT